VKSLKQFTESTDETTRSPDHTSRSDTKPAVESSEQDMKSPDRVARFPELLKLPLRSPDRATQSPELSNQVIKSPERALTSPNRSLGRPLSKKINSPEPSRSPKQVIRSPELSKQKIRSPELTKQGIKSPELSKQGIRSTKLAKQVIRLPELSKQGIRSPDTVVTSPNHSTDSSPKQGIRLSVGGSHEQVKRKQELVVSSHEQVKRSQVGKLHNSKASGRLAGRLLSEGSPDQDSSSSPSKLSDQVSTTKTTPSESPADRLLPDNRVCRLAVTPLKTSPAQQQSNGSSSQQKTKKPARQKKGQPIILPERRILKLPKKHFPSWRGQMRHVANCEVSQNIMEVATKDSTTNKSDSDKHGSKCGNSSDLDGKCDSQCASSKHCDDSKCTSSTEHCNSDHTEHQSKHCYDKSASSSEHNCANEYCDGDSSNFTDKCVDTAQGSSTGLCNSDTKKGPQNTAIFGDSAGCHDTDIRSNDKLLSPNTPVLTCSNTECTLPMSIASSDKDPRLQSKVPGVKRPCVSEDGNSAKKCCSDGECESRPDLLSDLPQRFSYATLYQGLIKCSSDISTDKKPALSNPGTREVIRPVHPVLQEHSYPFYHDIEMPLLIKQQREAPPCSVCLDEKMWVCMMCEKVTHSWCLSRPHTYCWDCLSSVGNILTDVK